MNKQEPLTPADMVFIEEFSAIIYKMSSLPLSVGKVLGLLLLCEPDYQSAESIQRSLHLSTGSVSTATSLLRQIQVVTTLRFPDDRRLYYRVEPGCWSRLLQLRIEQTEHAYNIAQKGLAARNNNSRIAGMVDLYKQSIIAMRRIDLHTGK